jgi:hypothetical protein
MTDLQYFCYLSRNKVDQLYEQIDPESSYEITELREKETTLTADAHADWTILHIVSLFRVGGTYGRKGRIQREAKIKQNYMTKLQAVCLALAKEAPIPAISTATGDESVKSGWFHHCGEFRVVEAVEDPRSDAVVTLSADLGSKSLLLDCSLRNFSEGSLPDGSFALNSANARFFKANVTLTMTTIFLLIELSGTRKALEDAQAVGGAAAAELAALIRAYEAEPRPDD